MNKCLLIAVVAFALATNVTAQEKKTTADSTTQKTDTLPYIKYPTLPAFNIMLLDSVTIFNTFNIPEGRPIVIMFFDPDCKHCREEIKRLVAGMDSLKNIRFYLVTSVHDYGRLRAFYDEYHLGDFKNIDAVGRDYEYFFITYYGVKFVPDLVLYDGQKNLVKFFEGHATVDDLYDLTHK